MQKYIFSLIFYCFHVIEIYAQCFAIVNSKYDISCGIKSDGTLWAWGDNFHNTTCSFPDSSEICKPVKIGNEYDWNKISIGGGHILALKNNGTLWGWGYNKYGQLGDGTNINKSLPVQIGNENNWAEISSGGCFSIGLKDDGTIWAWGDNTYGQLGNGTNTFGWFGDSTSMNKVYTPTQIGVENNWKKISAGGEFVLGLKTDGTIWSWGRGTEYQLGNLNVLFSNYPEQIEDTSIWTDICSGERTSFAIKNDSTLWGWGYNIYGQLGESTHTEVYLPSQIGQENDWVKISADDHALGVKVNGTLWSWGRNNRGQLGNGSTINNSIPFQIGQENDWFDVISGNGSSFALKTDGTLWVWGSNTWGQLGDGSYQDKSIPTQFNCENLNVTDEEYNNSIVIFPNFIENNLSIHVPNIALNKSYFISDYNGRVIIEDHIQENQFNINVSNLSSGNYIFEMPEINIKKRIIKL